jgi:hypothetical protein
MTDFTTNIYTKTDKHGKYDNGFKFIHETFINSNLIDDYEYSPSDLGVVYSWINDLDYLRSTITESDVSPHWSLKAKVITEQLREKRSVLAVDSNVFLYKSETNLSYLRYSINGIYANTGYYFDLNIDHKRWEKISSEYNISIKPWHKRRGDKILLCLPRSYGFTYTEEINLEEWVLQIIEKISSFSDRDIVIRPHPGDRKMKTKLSRLLKCIKTQQQTVITGRSPISKKGERLNLLQKYPIVMRRYRNKLVLSLNNNIETDLMNAWCTVCYGGTVPCISVIEGIPTFIMDSNPRKNLAYKVSNAKLKMIENPNLDIDRQSWVERISMSHFSFEDIKEGLLYKYVNEFFENRESIERR